MMVHCVIDSGRFSKKVPHICDGNCADFGSFGSKCPEFDWIDGGIQTTLVKVFENFEMAHRFRTGSQMVLSGEIVPGTAVVVA